MMQTVITGSGRFVPLLTKSNSDFVGQTFYDENHTPIAQRTVDIIQKFEAITGIQERRYADSGMTASCMAAFAAKAAIQDAGIDAETIDQVIVAHNFGDISAQSRQSDAVPCLASRVKHKLGIKNHQCVAYDILFGCPGWLQALIQADAFCKAGIAKTCLVIGTETLSRVLDVHDRDSMIYADGAGAVIVQQLSSPGKRGIMKGVSASYSGDDVDFIYLGGGNNNINGETAKYLKMQGRKVYEFALKHVPSAIKDCLDINDIDIQDVKKIFIHQANEKMDEAIIKRLFELCGVKTVPCDIMPMNIKALGNSSVATIPTLFDMVRKNQLYPHTLNDGDIVVFASVGAGMNINALCYTI